MAATLRLRRCSTCCQAALATHMPSRVDDLASLGLGSHPQVSLSLSGGAVRIPGQEACRALWVV